MTEGPTKHMDTLGITLQANLGWTDNVAGLVTSLNHRVGLVRRLLKWIPRCQIQPIVDGLVISKLRYGLPVFGQVRLQDTDPTHGNMKKLQGVLNDLMRLVANKRISDKISCVDLSEMTGIPSLNRICASATLKELKRASDLGWPLADVLEPAKTCYGMGLRSQTSKLARLPGPSTSKGLDIRTMATLWNQGVEEGRMQNSKIVQIMDPALLKIGDSSILPCSTMKLLGITLQANLGWTANVAGLVTSLNQRFGLVRRLLKWIPRCQIQPIVDGLVISKLRYGLPVFGQVRLQDTDPTHGNMKKLQGVLNDLMRLVANKRISDKISCVDLSEMTGIPSLNRICASATLKELKRASDLGWPLADVLEPAKTCYGMGLRSQTSKLARLPGPSTRKGLDIRTMATLWNQGVEEGRMKNSKIVQIVGRFMVATRDIQPLELILEDSPAVFGPNHDTEPICLECLVPVDGSFLCPICGLPLCGEKCFQAAKYHPAECGLLSNTPKGYRMKVDFSRVSQRPNAKVIAPEYCCITPLRLLALKKTDAELWSRVQMLMDHDEDRRKEEDYWNMFQINAVDFLRKICGFDYSEEEIFRATGIIRTNAFHVEHPYMKLHGTSGGAVFPTFSFLSHSCVANAKYSVSSDNRLSLRAQDQIPAGSEISIQYLSFMFGDLKRKSEIRDCWFFQCLCRRSGAGPKENFDKLEVIFGSGRPSRAAVYKIIAKVKTGEDTEDRRGKTSTRTGRTCDNFEAARAVVTSDQRVTVEISSSRLDLSNAYIHRMHQEDHGCVKKSARFMVTMRLCPNQKSSRFSWKKGIKHLSHPPYSPDLAPADFFLFPKCKKELTGVTIKWEDVTTNLDGVCGTIPIVDFVDAFHAWKKRWEKCIQIEGATTLINSIMVFNNKMVLASTVAVAFFLLLVLDQPSSAAAGHGHKAHGTACIVKGSYCSCHHCKCEKGHIHCDGHGKKGYGKKYCYGSMEGEYCHCDYCKCKHGFGTSGYGNDVGGEENLAEGVPRATRPILTVEG
eukprot:snap_masked-scaffold15_size728074-processed-gene-2.0 protein:Tk08846 transcript:snap_masked-scaffold15_size728074-processed-gene-2.0-mRNA-1 annotation:"protein isoform a"